MKLARSDSSVASPRVSGTAQIPVLPFRAEESSQEWRSARTVWRRKGTVFLVALVGAAVGMAVAFQQKPLYRARMTMEIQPASQVSSTYSDGTSLGYILRTQVERLRSQSLARTALQRLGDSSGRDVASAPSIWQRMANFFGVSDLSTTSGRTELLEQTARNVQVNVMEGSAVVELNCDSPDRNLAVNYLHTLSAAFMDQTAEAPANVDPVAKPGNNSDRAAMNSVRARIIDPAEATPSPYRTGVWQKALGGLLAGVICGMVLVVAVDRADNQFGSSLAAGRTLGLRVLSVIPSAGIEPDARRGRFARSVQGLARRNGSIDYRDEYPLELITFHRKPSLLAESFRSTVSSLLISDAGGILPQVMLITSPGHHEGKTAVACNLAVAMAEMKKRVLLVDAHMRMPRVHSIFDVANSWGLSDVLAEGIDLDQFPPEVLVKESRVPRVYVLPSGPAPVSVVTLLHSGRLGTLLRRLRGEFDAIIVDGPPALDLGGARLMSQFADGIVLVVRANLTKRAAAVATVQTLTQDKAPILGFVWNDADSRPGRDVSSRSL